jgi:hypothetical protein
MHLARRMAKLEAVWVNLPKFSRFYLQEIPLLQQVIRTCTTILFTSILHVSVHVTCCKGPKTTTMGTLHNVILYTLLMLTIHSRIFMRSKVHRNKLHWIFFLRRILDLTSSR